MVDGKTLRGTVITVDAQHCQRDHVTYLAERGADWMLTVKGNQPTLLQHLVSLPWRAVPDVTREAKPRTRPPPDPHNAAKALIPTHPQFAEIRFAPDDFRRLFATDLVNNGLPIHIGAALLGHLDI